MATFFGEVLPVTSRAFDDDEEEDDDDVVSQPQRDPVIYWAENIKTEIDTLPNKKIPCKVLVIAVSLEANAFTDVYVKPFGYDMIGAVRQSSENGGLPPRTSSTEKTCYIYRSCKSPTTLVCQCKVDVPPENSYSWAKLLMDNLDLSAADIIILATSGMSSYCSDQPLSEMETPFLRCLKTEHFAGFTKCTILEQPNMVTGLPAQLMTFFQVYRYKAAIFICFKEKRYLDIAEVKIFNPVLQLTSLKDVKEVNKNADSMLKDIIKLNSAQDLMYM